MSWPFASNVESAPPFPPTIPPGGLVPNVFDCQSYNTVWGISAAVDTAAVNNAIAALNANGGGTLKLPNASFLYTPDPAGPNIVNCSGLWIEGGPKTNMVLQFARGSWAGISLINCTFVTIKNFTISYDATQLLRYNGTAIFANGNVTLTSVSNAASIAAMLASGVGVYIHGYMNYQGQVVSVNSGAGTVLTNTAPTLAQSNAGAKPVTFSYDNQSISLSLLSCQYVKIDNIVINDYGQLGIAANSCQYVTVTNITSTNIAETTINYAFVISNNITQSTNFVIDRFISIGGALNISCQNFVGSNIDCLAWKYSGGIVSDATNFKLTNYSAYNAQSYDSDDTLSNGLELYPDGVKVENYTFSNCSGGAAFVKGNNCVFSNCVIDLAGSGGAWASIAYGIEFVGNDNKLINSVISNSANAGVNIRGKRCGIANCSIKNNGKVVTASGIHVQYTSVGVDASNATITGCNIFDDQGSPTQTYGVSVDAGCLNIWVDETNQFSGNVTPVAAFYDVKTADTAALIGCLLKKNLGQNIGTVLAGVTTTLDIPYNNVRAWDIATLSTSLDPSLFTWYAVPFGANNVRCYYKNYSGASQTPGNFNIFLKVERLSS